MATACDAEQLKEIDFTIPTVSNPLQMIVPAGVEESRLFAFVRPFQPLVIIGQYLLNVKLIDNY